MNRSATAGLRQLPIFASLPKRALATASSLLTPVTFDDGDVLCEEGHRGREAFIVVSGSAAVSRGDEVLATVGAGDLVGELALLGNGLRTASVTAIEPVRAYVMSAQEFNSLLALPGVADAIHHVADERRPTPQQPVVAA
jgi:CRP/FNR family transcriptional regulator, cyclic AMP receptor protein